MHKVGGWVAIALAMACGGGSSSSRSAELPVDPGPGGQNPGGGADPSLPCGGRITLRLLGLGLAEGHQVSLAVSSVEVARAGLPLPTTFAARGDATFPVAGAYRIAVLPRPDGAGAVDAAIHLGGGTWCGAEGCLALDTCGEPLRFRFDPAKVRSDACHVVVHLDLLHAIVPQPDGPVLLPRFSVHY